MKKLSLIFVVGLLLACSRPDNGVRVSVEKPVAPTPTPKARKEPIFYNGKIYQLSIAPLGGGIFDLVVDDMTAQQPKDAIAVATSSLRYFACPDGKTGKLTNQPRYVGNAWKMSARCG